MKNPFEGIDFRDHFNLGNIHDRIRYCKPETEDDVVSQLKETVAINLTRLADIGKQNAASRQVPVDGYRETYLLAEETLRRVYTHVLINAVGHNRTKVVEYMIRECRPLPRDLSFPGDFQNPLIPDSVFVTALRAGNPQVISWLTTHPDNELRPDLEGLIAKGHNLVFAASYGLRRSDEGFKAMTELFPELLMEPDKEGQVILTSVARYFEGASPVRHLLERCREHLDIYYVGTGYGQSQNPVETALVKAAKIDHAQHHTTHLHDATLKLLIDHDPVVQGLTLTRVRTMVAAMEGLGTRVKKPMMADNPDAEILGAAGDPQNPGNIKLLIRMNEQGYPVEPFLEKHYKCSWETFLKIAKAEPIWREYGLDYVLANSGYAKSRSDLGSEQIWAPAHVVRRAGSAGANKIPDARDYKGWVKMLTVLHAYDSGMLGYGDWNNAYRSIGFNDPTGASAIGNAVNLSKATSAAISYFKSNFNEKTMNSRSFFLRQAGREMFTAAVREAGRVGEAITARFQPSDFFHFDQVGTAIFQVVAPVTPPLHVYRESLKYCMARNQNNSADAESILQDYLDIYRQNIERAPRPKGNGLTRLIGGRLAFTAESRLGL